MQTKTEIGLTRLPLSSAAKDADTVNLLEHFEEQIELKRISWSTSLQLCDLIGSGSQGRVFRAQRIGADGFRLPVAVKYFSPEIYHSAKTYDQAMAVIGEISSVVARIQHENLLVVNHFLNHDRIRVMVMEWIDGFDLRNLLTARMYGTIQERSSRRRWKRLNESLFVPGPVQPRLKIGAVVCVLQDCLSALSALHSEGVLHNDLKPSNVMLNRAGRVKLIDIGSASLVDDDSNQTRTFTPAYSPPEVLGGQDAGGVPSDLARLGYMAIEMLIGRPLHPDDNNLASLQKSRYELGDQLPALLEGEVKLDGQITEFLRKLTDPNPAWRHQTAEEALFDIQQLMLQDRTGTEARHCLRIWINELLD